MNKRWAAVLLAAALLPGGAALADWSTPDANLAAYTEQYGEASEGYKLIRYNAESSQVGKAKEALAALGYFPYHPSNNYYRTTETAVRLFAGQMRIGGDGSELTPLMQAMLADHANLPKAICPVIDITPYGWEADSASSYTPYTFQRLSRSSVETGAQVGFSGVITAAASAGITHYYTVQMEGDPAKLVYVAYEPLPRTTVYQTGDTVAVFGVTQGTQALPYPAMQTAALLIHADRVGYAAE